MTYVFFFIYFFKVTVNFLISQHFLLLVSAGEHKNVGAYGLTLSVTISILLRPWSFHLRNLAKGAETDTIWIAALVFIPLPSLGIPEALRHLPSGTAAGRWVRRERLEDSWRGLIWNGKSKQRLALCPDTHVLIQADPLCAISLFCAIPIFGWFTPFLPSLFLGPLVPAMEAGD